MAAAIGAIIGILVVIGIYLGVLAVMSLVIMWSWNIVIPAIFDGQPIEFHIAFALVVLLVGIRALLTRAR